MASTYLVPKNNAASTVASGLNNTTDPVTFTVATGEGALFPSSFPFAITVDSEILNCTARSTDSLTVSRAQQGTSAASHANGASVELRVTAKSISDLNTVVAGLEDNTALLAGRSGGQTIIGGTATADSLTLKPTSGATPTGDLIVDLSASTSTAQTSEWDLPTTLTWAQTAINVSAGQSIALGAAGGMRAFAVGGTYDIAGNVAGSPFLVFNMGPTINLSATGSKLNNPVAYRHSPTFSVTSGIAVSNAGVTEASGGYRVFSDVPAFATIAGGGSCTIATYQSYFAGYAVAAGWTLTNLYGGRIAAPTGVGTVTTMTGYAVEDFQAFVTGGGSMTTQRSYVSLGLSGQMQHAGPAKFGASGAVAALDHTAPTLELERSLTAASSPADGFCAALALDPDYTTSGTVTRHNYIDVQNVALSGSAAVTDAAVLRFDAAIGTHKAVASNGSVATTITSLGPTGAATTIQGWLKINVNGTLRYIPFW